MLRVVEVPLFFYGLWALFASMISGLIVGTWKALPHASLPRGEREKRTIVAATTWADFLLRWILLVDVKVIGSMDLPEQNGALIVSNHRSWLDPVLLISLTRSNGLSKQAIRRLPFIGYFGGMPFSVMSE